MFGNFSDGRGGLNPVDHHKTFKLDKVQVGLFRKNLYELKMDFDTIFDISEKMTDDNSQYGDLALGIGNQIADIIFTMDKLSDEDIIKARKKAQEFLSIKNHDMAHQIYAVGHCHIDTAWLWPFRETRRK
jgi:alpha-mannosidase